MVYKVKKFRRTIYLVSDKPGPGKNRNVALFIGQYWFDRTHVNPGLLEKDQPSLEAVETAVMRTIIHPFRELYAYRLMLP